MKAIRVMTSVAGLALLAACDKPPRERPPSEVVVFRAGPSELRGYLYKPEGPGPFPAVLFNHGSAPGMVNDEAFDAIAPTFVARGWAFFAPYRRGQGLSADAGPYIMDEIRSARGRGGLPAAAETMTRLLETDHLADHVSALEWLRAQPFVRPSAIATMGNSFGGIQAVLGAERGGYCAAVDAAGGAESWKDAPVLRERMIRAVRSAATPILFFQAENDFDVEPSRVLFAERKAAGKVAEIRLYPAFGDSAREGHSFPYRGVAAWRDDVLSFLDRHCPK